MVVMRRVRRMPRLTVRLAIAACLIAAIVLPIVAQGAGTTATCGTTTVGKAADALVTNQKRVNKCALPVAASIKKLTMYLAPTTVAGSQVLRGVLYADASGKPGALLATTNQRKF